MKKRLVALTLAATMIVGSSFAVCAAPNVDDMDAAASGVDVTGTGSMKLPTISVTVPTTADIVINPYQMEYTDEEGNKSSKQIVSAPQEIVNESDVAVAINVKDLTATGVKEGITISTTALTAKSTAKSAFLYLEVVKDGTDFAAAYDSKASTNQVVIPYVAADDTKTKKGAKDAIVTLDAGSTSATKAKFQIGGAVVANPTKVDSETKEVVSVPWTDGDEFGISFKFTFTPQIVAETTTP